MKWLRLSSAALVAFAFAACDSVDELGDLEVINQNNPERERALSEPGDIEALIGFSFSIAVDAYSDDSPGQGLTTAADEGSLSWGNHGAQQISSEPRVAWPNTPSWRYNNYTENPWYNTYEALSAVFDGLIALEDEDIASQLDLGRMTALGKLTQGLGHGLLAMFYDSAFIFDETVSLFDEAGDPVVLELQPYPTVLDSALSYLDQAIAEANSGISDMDPVWFSGNAFSAAEIIELANSLKARYAANVARTPAERGAYPAHRSWTNIYTWADDGIDAILLFDGDGGDLWDAAAIRWGNITNDDTWTRADYKSIGWTELPGGAQGGLAKNRPSNGDPHPRDAFNGGTSEYSLWLSTPLNDRNDRDIFVPDRRISPQTSDGGFDERGEGTYFQNFGPSAFRVARGTYHFSKYLSNRWEDVPLSSRTVPWPFFNSQELEMYMAEAAIRVGAGGGVPEAVSLINATRVTNGGLEGATAADNGTDANGDGVSDLMEMLIYEYRIENYYMPGGMAYFSRRGFGPLAATGPNHHHGPVEGTPLHYAMPGKEAEVLQRLTYTFGGVGNEGSTLAPMAAGPGRARGSMMQVSRIHQLDEYATIRAKLDAVRNRSREGDGVSSLTRHH